MAITLLNIQEQVRNRADMKESSFVEDSELIFYINQSIKELHDLITDAYGSDYYSETYEFLTVLNQDAYDLPADFYELRGVDVKLQGDTWFTIQRYNFNERNRYKEPTTWAVYNAPHIRYRLVGDKLRFNPPADTNTPIRLWYIPKAQNLVLATDAYNDFNGWIEYVIVDAAIKCLQKEESDVTILAAQKSALLVRIESKSKNRDAGSPESVYDIHAENSDFPWRGR